MAHSFGGWRLLVNIFLPIPLILTFLLVLPLPRNVRKGILLFTHKTLSFTMIGGMQLVHFSLIASGIPLVDSIFRTMRSADAVDAAGGSRPEVKIGLLAKKWREERNFWIAAMGFTLWCLLTVLFAQVTRMVKLEEDLEGLEDEVCDLKGVPRPARNNPHLREFAEDNLRRGRAAAERAGRAARAAGEKAAKEARGAAGRAAQEADKVARDVRGRAETKLKEAQGAVADFAQHVKESLPRGRRGASGSSSPNVRDASPATRTRAKASKFA